MQKISFSVSTKSSSKPTNFTKPSSPTHNSNHHEFVTEFDPTQTPPLQNPNKFTIPRLEDTWQPRKKMRNLDIPLHSSASDDPNLRFVVETLSNNPDSSDVTYGLNLRSKAETLTSETETESKVYVPIENVMLQKFKEDMESLPEAPGLEEFEQVPVEGYGAALLGAYGWKEGQGISRTGKKDVGVFQYVGRLGREGLGFEPEVEKASKGREVLMAKKGEDGRTRHVVSIDEKLVKRELKGVHVGKMVRVVGGTHVGLKGKVLEKLEGSGAVVVRLVKSDEEVRVKIDQVAEVGSVEDDRCLKKLKELEIDEERRRDGKRGGSSYDKKRDTRSEHHRQSSKRDGGGTGSEEEKRKQVSWLRSHIRVRIISKDFKEGKLYLKKGKVVDVVGPNLCDISMDESKELIQGVHQKILETALPRRGGPVLVLYGKHKGVFGDLVDKNTQRETGVVRDADSHALLNVHLEQVAEYIGDPSLIGY